MHGLFTHLCELRLMPWGPVVLGTQLTSPRLGAITAPLPLTGYVGSVNSSPSIDSLLNSPYVKGLIEVTSANTLAAVGTSPDFPIGPKWRKVVRQIG